MSKKSIKQHEQRKNAQVNAQPTQPPKKVKKREIEAWILAIFMIAWTICSVFGTIAFFRKPEQASAEAVEYSTAFTDLQNHHAAVSEQAVSIDECNFNALPLSSLVFSVGSSFAVFAGTFHVSVTPATFELQFTDGDTTVIFDLLKETTQAVSYRRLDDSILSFDQDNITVYCYTAPYDSPNAELLSSVPELRAYYPFSYSISDVGYDDINGGCVFQLNLRFKHVSLDNVYANYFIIIDTYVVEPSDVYSTAFAQFLPITDMPIYGLSYYYSTSSVYQEYYDIGYSDGDERGYVRGFNEGGTKGFKDGYDEGKADGFTRGEREGYDRGYAEGKEIGESIGEANGFNKGVASANEYTFQGLIGAVFDVPVQTFQSLFNFNVLGVDLSGFLLSLLSVMLILSIIKLII